MAAYRQGLCHLPGRVSDLNSVLGMPGMTDMQCDMMARCI
jgi:hypothetical protein